MTQKIPAEKARQGRKGAHVLRILLVSLLLALLVWGGTEIYGRWTSASENAPSAEQDQMPGQRG